MAQHIVWGCVHKDGATLSGAGFTAIPGGKGVYDIAFTVPFKSTPAITFVQNHRNWTDWTYDGGSTLDNVVLIAADGTKCKLATGNHKGEKEDRNFCLIAIGEI